MIKHIQSCNFWLRAPSQMSHGAGAGDIDTICHSGKSRWRVLLGHSMGGKVILQYLQHLIDHPNGVVQGLPEQACPVAGMLNLEYIE